MNVGVIGLGKMGILHTGILNSIPGVNIAAVSDKEKLINKHIGLALPGVKTYDDYEKMLANEKLDLVYITTPIKFHVPIAITCINQGINFFMEKPLSTNIEECNNLIGLLKGKDLFHAVGYSKRFWDTFSKAKELLDSKLLGDLLYVKSSMYLSQVFSAGKGWRFSKKVSGGGVLIELGAHVIDLLIWYFGPIKRVSGNTKSYYSKEVEDFAHSSLEFNNGLSGFIDVSWSVRGYRVPEISIEVHGSNGILSVNDDRIKLTLDRDVKQYPKGTTTIYKQAIFKGTLIDIGGADFTKEDIHMVNCITEKKQPMTNIFEASKTQSVIDSIYRSAVEKTSKEVRYCL